MSNKLTGYPDGPFPGQSSSFPGCTWELACPECGDRSIDRDNPAGGDHRAVVVYPDRDDYDSPIGTRGGYVQIDLQCSDGHHFALVIGNHKGAEIIGLARSEPR